MSPPLTFCEKGNNTVDAYHYRKAIQVLQRGVRPHYVYFCLAQPSSSAIASAVKVGTTHDPHARLSAIRAGTTKAPPWVTDPNAVSSLDYVGFVIGDAELERHLHKAFAEHRLVGEWFAYAPVATAIDELLRDACVCRGCQMEKSLAHI